MVLIAWGSEEGVRSALTASILTGIVWWAMALLPGRPLGMGDVKFQFILGGVLGYSGLFWALWGAAGSFFFGGIYALVRTVFLRSSVKTPIAFGPWMMASTLLVSVLRESVQNI